MHGIKYCCLFLMSMLWPRCLVAQLSQMWSQTTGASAPSQGGSVAAIDNSDSVYVIGSVVGPLDGQTNAGNADIVLQKYNSSGVKQWTRLRGSSGGDSGYAGTLHS